MPVLFAERVFNEGKVFPDQLIWIEGGRIVETKRHLWTEALPAGTIRYGRLAPGFFDIHINGGEELHFTESPTVETLHDIVEAGRAGGTAYVLPTCITSPWETIFQAIESVRTFRDANPEAGVAGMHLEGPFINPVKRGAHLERFIRKPTTSELDELIRYGKGVIRLLTVAPEYFDPGQLQQLQEGGITVSAGHSNATYAQASDAFRHNIRLSTHLYNAMSSFGHREPGLVGAIFDHADVYAPIILDGVHCSYAAARVAYRQKGEKLLLISDALFLNRKKKHFRWQEFEANLVNGNYVNPEGNLAGAAISLADGVVNAVREIGISIEEAVDMATSRPAEAVGLGDEMGKIAPGYPAVFTTFSPELEHFQVVSYT